MLTDIQILKREMRARGATNSQCDSKLVPMIVEIITGTTIFTDEDKAKYNKVSMEVDLHNTQMQLGKVLDQIKKVHEEYMEYQNYIDEFNKALLETETPEARDKMRAAQMFYNSVTIDTKYDNTAFINGLAMILSGGSAAVTELKDTNVTLKDPTQVRV